MDREILFRGKRVDNGEWVYGYLVVADGQINAGKHYILSTAADFSFGDNGNRIRIGCFVEVDSDTAGQYIGLTDKNEKRIFEGDIVSFNGIMLKIAFKNSEFCAEHIDGEAWTYPYLGSNAQYMEVVGNIHDNPELLGGITDVYLVRCKDCKYGVPTINGFLDDMIACENKDSPCGYSSWLCHPDWFCADGDLRT